MNDVWRSTDNGASWELVAENAEWGVRAYHQVQILPDGSVVLFGGMPNGDMWRSTDHGHTWTMVSEDTGIGFPDSSVVLPDGSIVVVGLGNSTNEIWRLQTAGSTERHPRHQYTDTGDYRVSLQVFNAGGFDARIKDGYLSVVEVSRILRLTGDLSFGEVTVGQTGTGTLTIHNDGNSPLEVSAIDYPDGFSGDWSGTVAANGSQEVTVTFTPAEVRSYTGTITVHSDKTEGTETIECSGTGLAAPTRIIRLTGDLSFDEVTVGQTGTGTLTIHNDGNSPLEVSAIDYPDGFSGDWSGTVAANGSQEVTVTFTPAEARSYTGTITVQSDKTEGTETIECSGTGLAAPTRIIRLSGDLSFGEVTVGQTGTGALTIHNDGNSPLEVSAIDYPDGFHGDWSGTVAANGSQEVTVTFTPAEARSFTGTITVQSDKTEGTGTIECSGTGVEPDPETIFHPFPDTGQTKCYGVWEEITCPAPGQPFYGQDAQFQPRLPRYYTKLGEGDTILADDAAHVDDGGPWIMTRDNVTGLIWEVKTSANKDDVYAWQAAADYAQGLTLGGHADWRLPTVKELSSLLNFGTFSYGTPPMDIFWFPHAKYAVYWSSTVHASEPDIAWSVIFEGGDFVPYHTSSERHVRAVRAPHSWGTVAGEGSSLVDNGDGTVTDSVTGLMWQKATAPGLYNWEDALLYAENLEIGGYDDWRLPNRNELQSIVDHAAISPAVAPVFANDTFGSAQYPYSPYWSSTTDAGTGIYVHIVKFYDGAVSIMPGEHKDMGQFHVRAVRAGHIARSSSVTVTIEPEGAHAAGARWRRAGTSTWLDSGATEEGVLVGMHTLEFANVQGWFRPADQVVVVKPDQTNTVTVTYIEDAEERYFPFPDTGQTKCYDTNREIACPSPGQPYHGQDAQYQPRLPRSYTKLGQGGVILPDNAVHVYDGGPWIMTRDNVTGLVWEVKNSVNKNDTYTWDNAQSLFITGLNNANFGGFTDWRLPTIEELASLVNSNIPFPGPTTDTTWFPHTKPNHYWSSTTSVYYEDNAWYAHYGSGGLNYVFKGNTFHARAVRSGGSRSFDNLIIHGDGTFTDPNTNLMWQTESISNGYNWVQALEYAQNLELAGYTDWRLPNRHELQSLIDYSQRSPSVTYALKDSTLSGYYFSSTTFASNPGDTFVVDFRDGFVEVEDKSYNMYIRAVRPANSDNEYGTLTVHVEPESARTAGARWRRLGTQSWMNSGIIESNVSAGQHMIEFKSIPGWVTPPNQSITVVIGQTAEATGTYTQGVFPGGDGSLENPYQIASAEHLDRIRDYPTRHFILTSDIDLGQSETAGGSTWNTGSGWSPIGTFNVPFTGTFNGHGRLITNLFIDRPDADDVGLFGVIGAGGQVTDLGVSNVQVVGWRNVGALAGRSQGTIQRVHVDGEVFGTEGGGKVGGLVGLNTGAISQSYATATVSSFAEAGGLVGVSFEGSITDCYATGFVGGLSSAIGGQVGVTDSGQVTRSYASGLVALAGATGDQGGLVGRFEHTAAGLITVITSSYWDTETSLQSQSAGGQGLTTAQMRDSASFVGWEFGSDKTWNRADGVNGGYPYLTFARQRVVGAQVSPENTAAVAWTGAYPHGAQARLAITPQAGRSIASATGCGGSLEGNTYQIPRVFEDCDVLVTTSEQEAPPAKPVLIAPAGTVNTGRPTFSWNAVSGANSYNLWVNDATGTRINQWYSAQEAGCAEPGEEACFVVSAVDLGTGTGKWWVRARNGQGSSPWSDPLDFTVSLSPPARPTLISPGGTISTNRPTYTWIAVNGATEYNLYVDDAGGNRINQWFTASATNCASGTGECTVAPSVELAAGDGRWWVRAKNSQGSGAWSNPMDFKVSSVPAKPTLISPSGNISSKSPTYTWIAVSNATWYQLHVDDATGNRILKWFTASQVNCPGGDGACSVTPTEELAGGSGSWMVRGWNDQGNGPWSDRMNFSVSSLPAKPTLVSPSGTITTNRPAFVWNAVSDATWYQLHVDDSTGNKVLQWYRASEANCSTGTGTCTVTPSVDLAGGNGSWMVRGWNDQGNGPWSEKLHFTVSAASPPGKVGLLSPSGTITTNRPTYTWNAVAGSTWYYLWVDDATGNRIKQWYTATQTGCPAGTGTCSITPSVNLAAGNARFWVHGWNQYGNGPWSDRMDFSVQ